MSKYKFVKESATYFGTRFVITQIGLAYLGANAFS